MRFDFDFISYRFLTEDWRKGVNWHKLKQHGFCNMQKLRFLIFSLFLSISTNLSPKSNVVLECLNYVNPISYLNEYKDSLEASKIKHGTGITNLNVFLAMFQWLYCQWSYMNF